MSEEIYLRIKKLLLYKIFYLFFFIFVSCSPIYFGISENGLFDPLNQPNILGPKVYKWEDGARIDENKKGFEWWYFDAELDDGSIIVLYFFRVHYFGDRFFIGFNFTSPDKGDYFKIKYFSKSDVSFSYDSCNVVMGQNIFKGNLNNYTININSKDFDGIGIELSLRSIVPPFRPQDGILKTEKEYFGWLAGVPYGKVKGRISIKGKDRIISGSGYHDHNWGNTPLQKLFKGWTWFRGHVDGYTIIAAELNVIDKKGGYDIPILFIGDSSGHLVKMYGNDDIYTKKFRLIKDLYPKKNEPQFRDIKFFTGNNDLVSITSDNVIDNTPIFKRMGIPTPIRWVFDLSKVDPFYTRFRSSLLFKTQNDEIKKGSGILEIMDLH